MTQVGLAFAPHPNSPYAVSGYVSYLRRLLDAFEHDAPGDITLHAIGEGAPDAWPVAEFGAPHLAPFSAAGEQLIDHLAATFRAASLDVVHIADWGRTGTIVFEACVRAGIPYIVSVVDYKPICAQSQLLQAGLEVCSGPSSTDKCRACLEQIGRVMTDTALRIRQRTLEYYLRRAERLIAFTDAHVDELEQWLRIGRDRYAVLPFDVPPAGDHYRKSPDAFTYPLHFAYVARTCPEWGIGLLLEAWSQAEIDPRQAVLDIYTDGAWRYADLQRRYAQEFERGAATVEVGTVIDHLDEIHADLAAVVVPSQWKNTGSSAASEALARGTAVITANRYGVYDSLPESQRALAYEMGDVADLMRALREAIDDPARLATAADQPIHSSFAAHIDALANLYVAARSHDQVPPAVMYVDAEGRRTAMLPCDAAATWVAQLDEWLQLGDAAHEWCLVLAPNELDQHAVVSMVEERIAAAGLAADAVPDLLVLGEHVPTDTIVPSVDRLLAGSVRPAFVEAAHAARIPVLTSPADVTRS